MRRSMFLLLALTGCTEQGSFEPGPPSAIPSMLVELGSIGVSITETSPLDAATARHVVVQVTHTFGTYCPILDESTTMSIGDRRLLRRSRGRYLEARTPDGPVYSCEPPTFAGDVPSDQAGPSSLHLADDTFTATYELGDMFAPRTASPIGQTDWSFGAGEEVVFAWSPASDLRVFGSSDATIAGRGVRSIPRLDGVHVTMPADMNARGSLTIRLDNVNMACGERCTARLSPSVTHAATIAP